jgi:asparagine synthase (glutamine-hydrolysing)
VVDIEPEIRDIFEPIVYALDEPHADDSAIPTWLLSERVGASYKVALTGIGGDELFGGYARHLGLPLSELYHKVPASVRRLLTRPRTSSPSRAAHSAWIASSASCGRAMAPCRSLATLHDRLGDEERSDLFVPGLRETITGHGARTRFRSLFDDETCPPGPSAAMYLDYKTYLPDDILALSDRLSMAHSLEIRVPFVDHELAAQVFPLPYHKKIGWWQNKRLLKNAMRSRLPEQHYTAPKRGFVGPTSAWLRNELRGVLHDELSPERQRRLGYFDPVVVSRLVQEHLDGRQNRERILWGLLSFST